MAGQRPTKHVGLKTGHSTTSIDRSDWLRPKPAAPGWYIFAWVSGEWRPYLPLRYRRERDASLGALALQDAGIDTFQKMVKAGHEQIKRIAAQYYEW